MEIYLDIVLMENFLMDYILLEITGKILQKEGKKLYLILAALLGSGFTCIYYLVPVVLPQFWNVITKGGIQILNLLCAVFMLTIAFHLTKGTEKILFLIVLYGLSFAMEGMLTWIWKTIPSLQEYRYPIITLGGMFLFGAQFLKRFVLCMKERYCQKQYSLPVLIRVGKKQAKCRGLMDSGNSLIEPISQKPVVIVEQSVLSKSSIRIPANGFFVIPYHAMGTEHGLLKGFLADEIEILGEQGEKKISKVMLGVYDGKLSMKGDYQVILHPKL